MGRSILFHCRLSLCERTPLSRSERRHLLTRRSLAVELLGPVPSRFAANSAWSARSRSCSGVCVMPLRGDTEADCDLDGTVFSGDRHVGDGLAAVLGPPQCVRRRCPRQEDAKLFATIAANDLAAPAELLKSSSKNMAAPLVNASPCSTGESGIWMTLDWLVIIATTPFRQRPPAAHPAAAYSERPWRPTKRGNRRRYWIGPIASHQNGIEKLRRLPDRNACPIRFR